MNFSNAMISEFAIDPETFREFHDIRFLLKEFSLPEGRVISRYPNKWPAKVRDIANNYYEDDMQIHRVVEWISNIRENTLVGRPDLKDAYKHDLSWLENAESVNVNGAFHAIISPNNSHAPNAISPHDIEHEHDLWEVEARVPIKCTLEGLCGPVEYILKKSSAVCIIDPYYSCLPKNYKPVNRLLDAAVSYTNLETFIFHTGTKASGTSSFFREHLENDVIVTGAESDCQILFVRWDIHEDTGERLHDRYLITNHCGFTYGRGFSIERGQKSAITRIKNSTGDLTSEFDLEDPVYTFKDAFRVSAGDGEGNKCQQLSLDELKAIMKKTHL